MSTSAEPELQPSEPEKQKIQLDVKVESPQACLREVIVTIPQAEVTRYLKEAYDELVPEANVPGFRAGRAPRKLVEKQFRDRVKDQVKGALLMDSLTEVTERQEFSAISEPSFDYESIELPEDGDFKFQFSVEVRPEFPTPQWRGLELTRPVEDIGDDDVNAALDRVMSRYATLEATDEPAEMGDKLLISATFKDGEKVLSTMEEERVTLQSSLSFSDGTCSDFGKLMLGVKEGETREGKVLLSSELPDESMQNKEVTAAFHVVEVLKRDTPELTPALLEELGDFESEEELRSFVHDSLVRQASFRTQQAVRKTVVDLLAGAASFDLPRELVRRQMTREIERKVLELRSSGFDEEHIRRYVNATRRNSQAVTETALREHFILEQIAEEENIDAEPADYEREITLIAQQSDMPERRVRARLEKSGQMDAVRNQIVERKVIEKIIAEAKVSEEKVTKKAEPEADEFAVFHHVLRTKDDAAIPEAKYDDNVVPGTEKENEKD